MPEDRFPYEQSTWSNSIETKAGWYTSLEQTGTESVKAQLLSHQGSSRSRQAHKSPQHPSSYSPITCGLASAPKLSQLVLNLFADHIADKARKGLIIHWTYAERRA